MTMNHLSEERLKQISGTPLSLAPSVCNYVDAWYASRELLIVREQLEQFKEAQLYLEKAVKFLDMCNKQRLEAKETGSLADAWEWLEEAAREMVECNKEKPSN